MIDQSRKLDSETSNSFKFFTFYDNIKNISINPLFLNDFQNFFFKDIGYHDYYDKNHNQDPIDHDYVEIMVNIHHVNSEKNSVIQNHNFNSETNSLVDHNNSDASNHHCIESVESHNPISFSSVSLDEKLYKELKTTFFSIALRYWESHCSHEDFRSVFKTLREKSSDLPSLLLNTKDILSILLDRIFNGHPYTKECFYHLLVILAKDIKDELTFFFNTILDSLLNSLDVKNSSSIELTFYTIGQLLRYCSRSILKNISTYIPIFIPLLEHEQIYIRFLTSQALSFLFNQQNHDTLSFTLSEFLNTVTLHYPAFQYTPCSNKLLQSDKSNSKICQNLDLDVDTDGYRVNNCVDNIDSKDILVMNYSTQVNARHINEYIARIFGQSHSLQSIYLENSFHPLNEYTITDDYNHVNMYNMAESIGNILHYLCAGIQSSLTSKTLIVFEFLIKTIVQYTTVTIIPELQSNVFLIQFLRVIASILMIRLRNHLKDIQSEQSTTIQNTFYSLLDQHIHNIQSFHNNNNLTLDTNIDTSSVLSIMSSIQIVCFSFRVMNNYMTTPPRPSDDYDNYIRSLANRLVNALNSFLSFQYNDIIKVHFIMSNTLDILQIFFQLVQFKKKNINFFTLDVQKKIISFTDFIISSTYTDEISLLYLQSLFYFIYYYIFLHVSESAPNVINNELIQLFIQILSNLSEYEYFLCLSTHIIICNDNMFFKQLFILPGFALSLQKIYSNPIITSTMQYTTVLDSLDTHINQLSNNLADLISIKENTNILLYLEILFYCQKYQQSHMDKQESSYFMNNDVYNDILRVNTRSWAFLNNLVSETCVNTTTFMSQSNLNYLYVLRVFFLSSMIRLLNEDKFGFSKINNFTLNITWCIHEDFSLRDQYLSSIIYIWYTILDEFIGIRNHNCFDVYKISHTIELFNDIIPYLCDIVYELIQYQPLVDYANQNVNQLFKIMITRLIECLFHGMTYSSSSSLNRFKILSCIDKLPSVMKWNILNSPILVLKELNNTIVSSLFSKKIPCFMNYGEKSLSNSPFSSNYFFIINFSSLSSVEEYDENINNLVELLLKLESTENTFFNQKDKEFLITSIGNKCQLLYYRHNSTLLLFMCIQCLFYQLKLQYTPLWDTCIQCLSQIIYSVSTTASKLSHSMMESYSISSIETLNIAHIWLYHLVQSALSNYFYNPNPSHTDKISIRSQNHQIKKNKMRYFQMVPNYSNEDKLIKVNICPWIFWVNQLRPWIDKYSYKSKNDNISYLDYDTFHNTCIKLCSHLPLISFNPIMPLNKDLSNIKEDIFIIQLFLEWIISICLMKSFVLIAYTYQQCLNDLDCHHPYYKFFTLLWNFFRKHPPKISNHFKSYTNLWLNWKVSKFIISSEQDYLLNMTVFNNMWNDWIVLSTTHIIMIPDYHSQLCILKLFQKNILQISDTLFEMIEKLITGANLHDYTIELNDVYNNVSSSLREKDLVLSFIIRIAFTKLLKIYDTKKGHISLSSRRKTVFSLLSSMPKSGIPILLTTLLRQCINILVKCQTRPIMFMNAISEWDLNHFFHLILDSKFILNWHFSLRDLAIALKDKECIQTHSNDIIHNIFNHYTIFWSIEDSVSALRPMNCYSDLVRLSGSLSSVKEMLFHFRMIIHPFNQFLGQLCCSVLWNLVSNYYHTPLETIYSQYNITSFYQEWKDHIHAYVHTHRDSVSILSNDFSSSTPSDSDKFNMSEDFCKLRLKKIIRLCFTIFFDLVRYSPDMMEIWNNLLYTIQPCILLLFSQALESGSSSKILKLVIDLGLNDQSYSLFNHSLKVLIPVMCHFIASNPIKVSIDKGNWYPNSLLMIINLFVHFCTIFQSNAPTSSCDVYTPVTRNRNFLDNKSQKNDSFETSSHIATEISSQINTPHTVNITVLKLYNKPSYIDTNNFSDFILEPYMKILLSNMICIVKSRQTSKNNKICKLSSINIVKYKNIIFKDTIHPNELNMIILLSKLKYHDSSLFFCLLDILCQSFPINIKTALKNPAIENKLASIISCIYQILTCVMRITPNDKFATQSNDFNHYVGVQQYQIHIPLRDAIEKTKAFSMNLLNTLDHVILRQELAEIHLMCVLILSNHADPEQFINNLQHHINSFSPNDNNTHFLKNWYPESIDKFEINSCQCKENTYSWGIYLAVYILCLSSLKRKSVDHAQNDDLYYQLLSDHMLYHTQPLKMKNWISAIRSLNNEANTLWDGFYTINKFLPAHEESILLIQFLFLLKAQHVDNVVKRLALNIIKDIIYRLHHISECIAFLKHNYHLLIDGKDINTLNHQYYPLIFEWTECSKLLNSIVTNVMPTIHHLLTHSSNCFFNDGIEIIYSLNTQLINNLKFLPLQVYSLNTQLCYECFVGNKLDIASLMDIIQPLSIESQYYLVQRLHLDLTFMIRNFSTLFLRSNVEETVFSATDGLEMQMLEEHVLKDSNTHYILDLVSIQKDANISALNHVLERIKTKSFTKWTLKHILLPLSLFYFFQPSVISKSRKKINILLCETSIKSIAEISNVISWKSFVTLVRTLFESLKKYPIQEQFIIRCLSKVFDSINNRMKDVVTQYLTAEANDPNNQLKFSHIIQQDIESLEANQGNPEINSILDHNTSSFVKDTINVSHNSVNITDNQQDILMTKVTSDNISYVSKYNIKKSDQIQMIQNSIKKHLIPLLKKFSSYLNHLIPKKDKSSCIPLINQSGKLVRLSNKSLKLLKPMLVVIHIQLLRHLSVHDLHSNLPTLIQNLIEYQLSRQFTQRKKSRLALCHICKDLGPAYLPWIFTKLSDNLNKGYQVPVLGYTILAILKYVIFHETKPLNELKKANVYLDNQDIDDILETVFNVIIDETERILSTNKSANTDSITNPNALSHFKMPETKFSISNTLLFILGRTASLHTILNKVLKFLISLFGDSPNSPEKLKSKHLGLSTKYKNIIQTYFQHIILGINYNNKILLASKLEIIYRLLLVNSYAQNNISLHLDELFNLNCKETDSWKFEPFNSSVLMLNDEHDSQAISTRLYPIECQPGAASGRSAIQSIPRSIAVEPQIQANLLVSQGLSLFLLTEKKLRSHPNFIPFFIPLRLNLSEDQKDIKLYKESQKILSLLLKNVVDCYCSKNDILVPLASQCLLKLSLYSIKDWERYSYRICHSILEVFRQFNGNASCEYITKLKNLINVSTKLLATLMIRPASAKWFNKSISDNSEFLTTGRLLDTKKSKNNNLRTSFKTSLLSHIYSSLDNPTLRLHALQIFRRYILFQQNESIIKDKVQTQIVNNCIDEVGLILVQKSYQEKLACLCGSIYIEFLMGYPMTQAKQEYRITFLLKNLDYSFDKSQEMILAVLYELVKQLPSKILTEHYSKLFVLTLLNKLEDEDISEKITNTILIVLRRIIWLVKTDGDRFQLFSLVEKIFKNDGQSKQLTLLYFMKLYIEYYKPLNLRDERLQKYVYSLYDAVMNTYLKLLNHSSICIEKNVLDVAYKQNDVYFETRSVILFEEKYNSLCVLFVEVFNEILINIDLRSLLEESWNFSDKLENKQSFLYFLGLWKFFVAFSIKLTSNFVREKYLLVFLNTLSIIFKSLVDTNECYLYMKNFFSLNLLEEVVLSRADSKTRKFSPLSSILCHLVRWIFSNDGETHYSLSKLTSRIVISICKLLLRIPLYINDYLISEENGFCHSTVCIEKLDPPIAKTHINNCNKQTNNINCKKILSNNSNGKCNSNLKCDSKEVHRDHLEDHDNITLNKEHMTSVNDNLHDNTMLIDNKLELEKNNSADESLLYDLFTHDIVYINEFRSKLEKECSNIKSMSSIQTDNDLNYQVVASSFKNLINDDFLRSSGLKWIITRITWGLRNFLKSIHEHFVRIIVLLETLWKLFIIIPLDYMMESNIPFVQSILVSIYQCSTIVSGKGVLNYRNISLDTLLTDRFNVYKDTAADMEEYVALTADGYLRNIEKYIENTSYNEKFRKIMANIRLSVKEKRIKRRKLTLILKTKNPQLATLQKLKKNKKKKEKSKRIKFGLLMK